MPQPPWNTETRTPYAAATDSRFRTIAVAGITIDRNVQSRSRNARPSTNAKTYSWRPCSCLLKSTDRAVAPVTWAVATLPIVSGTIDVRSVSRARSEALSLILPEVGTEIRARVPAGFVSTVIGSCTWPEASASRLKEAKASTTGLACTFGAETTTWAGAGPPGNAAWMRLYVFMIGRLCGRSVAPG